MILMKRQGLILTTKALRGKKGKIARRNRPNWIRNEESLERFIYQMR